MGDGETTGKYEAHAELQLSREQWETVRRLFPIFREARRREREQERVALRRAQRKRARRAQRAARRRSRR